MMARPDRDGSVSNRLELWLEALWRDYAAIAPSAERIRALFAADNPRLANDHVAFRTFDRDPIRLARLEAHLFELGYRRFAPYHFEDKQVDAWSYVVDVGAARPAVPTAERPRVFLSQLRTDALSASARRIVDGLLQAIPADSSALADASVFHAGRLWPPPEWEAYEALARESEYAAWLSVFGLRANHFTISVNSLETPTTLEGVVARVEAAGFAMNAAGGVIKGSPEVLLEQASTLADRVEVTFADGRERAIPSCYYEFARRYADSDGELYQGFVAASANRIFESTDR